MNQTLLVFLAALKQASPELRFLLVGDPEQFRCPCDSWQGSEMDPGALERSALLHQLAGGVRVKLTQSLPFPLADDALSRRRFAALPGAPRYTLAPVRLPPKAHAGP